MRTEELGEILNISVSAGAAAISELVDKEVKITVSDDEQIAAGSLILTEYEPTICFEYELSGSLSDKSIIIMKLPDAAALISAVLQKEIPEEFELDEVNKTAASQVIGDFLKGSFAALKDFAKMEVTASEAEPFPAPSTETLLKEYYNPDTMVYSIKLALSVNGLIDSEFVMILNEQQANALIAAFNQGIAKAKKEPEQGAPAEVEDVDYGTDTDDGYDIRPVELQRYSESEGEAVEQSSNLNMLMNVPLQITVEIGRSKKQIKDILELGTGSIVELNKPAGSHVDVFVNGQPIASGEVVVVDDYYGVRISEILNTGEIMKIL